MAGIPLSLPADGCGTRPARAYSVKLHFGSPVTDAQGRTLGTVSYFVLTLQLGEVSLVVLDCQDGERRVVPPQALSEGEEGRVVLGEDTARRWDTLPRYYPGRIADEHVPEQTMPAGARTGTVLVEPGDDSPLWHAREDDAHVAPDTEVRASDGKLGTLAGVEMGPGSARLVGIEVDRGRRQPCLALPLEALGEISGRGVQVRERADVVSRRYAS